MPLSEPRGVCRAAFFDEKRATPPACLLFFGRDAHTEGVDTNGTQRQTFGADIRANIRALKEALPAEDILVYEFTAGDGTACAAVYADGITDKELLGGLAARPLAAAPAPKTLDGVRRRLLFPEVKEADDLPAACKEILAGNPALLVDGAKGALVLGTKKVSLRAVAEPQTAIAIKGPREGFIEDVKTNMGLIRRRLKTPALRFVMLEVGRYSPHERRARLSGRGGGPEGGPGDRGAHPRGGHRRGCPTPPTSPASLRGGPTRCSNSRGRRKSRTSCAPRCWKGASPC